ncbi:hypothetical protein ABZ547_04965 [Streptomyces sparsogenes]|uniref:hypothetical protein n=1 Tax=Streptomyces sparsogenes TaxID=67365 RepID=UPI0033C7CE50
MHEEPAAMAEGATPHSWAGVSAAPPPTGLSAARTVELLREETRELPYGGFPMALRPFVLPLPCYRELLGAAETLVGLLDRAARHLAPDRAGRMAALGVDPRDCPGFTDDEDFEVAHWADMARADVVIGPHGPRFVEVNVSGAFGGLVHFHAHQQAWQRVREEAGRPPYTGVDPFPSLAELIRRTCEELGAPPQAVLVGTRRLWGSQPSARFFGIQTAQLRRHGIPAVHLDFEELHAGIGLPGPVRRPLGIAQFALADAEAGGYDVGPAWRALEHGFRMIPSQSSWFLHSKKLLALLSEGMEWMTPDQRSFVARYVPWTRVVDDREVEWRGRRHSLRDLLLRRRERFVLKGATGFGGAEVTFGAATGAGEWAGLVAEARLTGRFVVQEVVEPTLFPLDVALDGAGTVARVAANPVVSPFVLGGVASGCYVKFSTDPGPGVVSASRSAVNSCLLGEA